MSSRRMSVSGWHPSICSHCSSLYWEQCCCASEENILVPMYPLARGYAAHHPTTWEDPWRTSLWISANLSRFVPDHVACCTVESVMVLILELGVAWPKNIHTRIKTRNTREKVLQKVPGKRTCLPASCLGWEDGAPHPQHSYMSPMHPGAIVTLETALGMK